MEERKYLEVGTRPWGRYLVLDEGPGWKVKRIEVEPGQRLSLQSHKHRAEEWRVVAGVGLFTAGSRVGYYKAGDGISIAKGKRHRMENEGKELLVVIEVQLGEVLDELDIIRYSDDYGRTDAQRSD